VVSGQVEHVSEASPGPRMEHTLMLVDNILVLMGGYDDNVVYDDTWYFNITTHRWLRKETFVHALWPSSCTDDLALINDPASNCTELLWTQALKRDDFSPFELRPWGEQPYYYPDPDNGRAWSILDKGQAPPAGFKHMGPRPGTPVFPYAATAPRQYARPFVYRYNGSHSALLHEYCLSVKGEPTRDTPLDGKAGRANATVLVPQPRRQVRIGGFVVVDTASRWLACWLSD
jgi:hypothetical protein